MLDFDLEVSAGARVALVGANGAGKSTLLKAIVGLVPTTGGEVSVFGGSFRSQRHRVAYLPQVGELDWRFPVTVERLVLTGRYVHLGWIRRPGRSDRELAASTLKRLGIEDLGGRQIGQLSGGQRQRALLARALVQKADILLLDEPFNAVDAESRAVMLSVLDELRARGTTVLMATHQLDVDANQAVYLSEGKRVVQLDPSPTHHHSEA
ncbi:MAG TPA: ABC transporter ATP-binding protein [Chloroflexota bacterium]